jgi:hypothetical protein
VLALRAAGFPDRAAPIANALQAIVTQLSASRPIEAVLVESQILATEGKSEEAGALLMRMLETAPPGFAGWTLPVEPFLLQLHGTEAFTAALRKLAGRAGT